MVAGGRGGGYGNLGVLFHAAAVGAADGAHGIVEAVDRDVVVGNSGRVGLEGGGVSGVSGYGNDARVVGVAVLPLHKVVAAVGGGGEGCRGTVGVLTAAADRAHRVVVGRGGEGVGVGCEEGIEGDIAREGEGVGVGRRGLASAVLPLHEVVAGGRCGGYGNQSVLLHAAAVGTADGAHGIVEAVDRDAVVGNGGCVSLEGSGVGGVSGYYKGARVIGVSVLPLHEVVAAVGGGGEGGSSVVVIAAAAADATHGGIGAVGSNGVTLGREGGGVSGIAGNSNGARVVGVAVLPLHEVVTCGGRGGEGGRGTVVVAAAAAHRTHAVVAGVGGEGVTVDGEMGGEADVAGNGEGVGVGGGHLGAAFIPCGEVVARGGRGGGGEGGTLLDDAVANRRNRAPSGVGAEGEAHGAESGELHIIDGGRRVAAIGVVVVPEENEMIVSRGGYWERVGGTLPGNSSTERTVSQACPAIGDTRSGGE